MVKLNDSQVITMRLPQKVLVDLRKVALERSYKQLEWVSRSELIREAIDGYLEQAKEDKKGEHNA